MGSKPKYHNLTKPLLSAVSLYPLLRAETQKSESRSLSIFFFSLSDFLSNQAVLLSRSASLCSFWQILLCKSSNTAEFSFFRRWYAIPTEFSLGLGFGVQYLFISSFICVLTIQLFRFSASSFSAQDCSRSPYGKGCFLCVIVVITLAATVNNMSWTLIFSLFFRNQNI